MTTSAVLSEPVATPDVFPINGTDYIEFYVGNAKQAAHYYRTAFGFQLVAYRGPETGVRDRASYVLQQDKVRFVLTTAPRPRRRRSPSTCTGTATACATSRSGWTTPARRSRWPSSAARSRACTSRRVLEDDHGEVVIAAIRTYGDTIHSLVERAELHGRSSCPASAPLDLALRRRRPSASSTSTTASATSSWAR